MDLLEQGLSREVPKLHREGVRICHIGQKDNLAPGLQKKIADAEALTRDNQRITFNVAFNYGGRAEIVDAVRRLLEEGADPKQLTEASLARHLYTADQPDPDLIIRTGGDMRLSNFLIWQAAYAEYYSTPTYWPDFGKEALYQALLAYQQRERRFGRVLG